MGGCVGSRRCLNVYEDAFSSWPSKLLWSVRIPDPSQLAWVLLLLQSEFGPQSTDRTSANEMHIDGELPRARRLSHVLLHTEQVNVARTLPLHSRVKTPR